MCFFRKNTTWACALSRLSRTFWAAIGLRIVRTKIGPTHSAWIIICPLLNIYNCITGWTDYRRNMCIQTCSNLCIWTRMYQNMVIYTICVSIARSQKASWFAVTGRNSPRFFQGCRLSHHLTRHIYMQRFFNDEDQDMEVSMNGGTPKSSILMGYFAL